MNRKIIGNTVGTTLNPERIIPNGYASAIITNAQGETITTTDSANVKPNNIKLFGKGTQKQYEGKNLFGGTSYTLFPLYLEKGTEITVSCSDVATQVFGIYDVDQKRISYWTINEIGNGRYYKHIVLSEDVHYVMFDIWNYGASKEYQLELDTVATSYEPFVGGESSPNMNYPQIPVFHGESGSIVGKVLNSNLIDVDMAISTATGTAQDKTYFKFENGKEYAISLLSKVQDTNKWICVSANSWNDSLQGSRITFSSIGELSTTFTIPNDGLEYYLYLCDSGAPVAEQYMNFFNGTYLDNLQIEYGSTNTDFTQYTEQPFTSLTPNGLKGIPLGATIPDAIKNSPIHMSGVYWDTEEGQYYIADTKNEDGKNVQRIVEFVLTGQENCNAWGSKAIFVDLRSKFAMNKGYCTHYQNKSLDNVFDGIETGIYIHYQYGQVCFYDENYDATSFKTMLAEKYAEGNPIKVYCILADPITTDLTTEEIDQFNSLVMNYPITNVVNDAGAYMEVEYVADTKCYIDNKFKELEANITSAIAQLL